MYVEQRISLRTMNALVACGYLPDEKPLIIFFRPSDLVHYIEEDGAQLQGRPHVHTTVHLLNKMVALGKLDEDRPLAVFLDDDTRRGLFHMRTQNRRILADSLAAIDIANEDDEPEAA